MNEQSSNQNDQIANIPTKGLDEKHCESCGNIIKIKAEICPNCGVRQKEAFSKTALLLITFFLGGIGGHKFYTGKYLQGFFYLLFFWTYIPTLIAFIEFIIYACTSSEQLQEKYTAAGGGIVIAIIAGAFFVIAIIGILAAIAIPNFITYRNRSYQASVKSELQNLLVAEQLYFVEHNRYSLDLTDLDLTFATSEITIEIVSADENCFEAIAMHSKLQEPITIDCNGLGE